LKPFDGRLPRLTRLFIEKQPTVIEPVLVKPAEIENIQERTGEFVERSAADLPVPQLSSIKRSTDARSVIL
jgi:hypothetical protein